MTTPTCQTDQALKHSHFNYYTRTRQLKVRQKISIMPDCLCVRRLAAVLGDLFKVHNTIYHPVHLYSYDEV